MLPAELRRVQGHCFNAFRNILQEILGSVSVTSCYWHSGNQEWLEENDWSKACPGTSPIDLLWCSAQPKFRVSWMFSLVWLCIFPERKITGPLVLWILLACSFTDTLSWLWTKLLQLQTWFKVHAVGKRTKKGRLLLPLQQKIFNCKAIAITMDLYSGNLFLHYVTAVLTLSSFYISPPLKWGW